MSNVLPTARVVITTNGNPLDGFTFAVLGDDPIDGGEAPAREQYENNVFDRDQAGNQFVSGVVYRFTAEHDELVPDAELVRIRFNDDGSYSTLSPGETTPPAGTPPLKPGLQEVTEVWNRTDLAIVAGKLARSYQDPINESFEGFAVYKRVGVDEYVEKITLNKLRAMINSSADADTYNVAITVNTCTKIGGWLVNLNTLVPAEAKLYIDDTYIANIKATAANAELALQKGLPVDTLLIWNFDIPVAYQTNNVHSIEIRHIVTGVVFGNAFTPGSCGIQTTPKPTFEIIQQWEEIPAAPGVNPVPMVNNPQDNTVITSNTSGTTITFADDEFTDPGDTLTYTTTGWNGAEIDLPSGVVAYTKSLFIPAGINANFVVRRKVKDTANQPAAYTFQVTFSNTPTQPTDPTPTPYVERREIYGTTQLQAGGAPGEWSVIEWLSNGSSRPYTGPGTPSWKTPYPNYAGITNYDPANGDYTWSSALVSGTVAASDNGKSLKMQFKMPDGTDLTPYPVLMYADNNTANRPPVVNKPVGTLYVTAGQGITFPMAYTADEFTDPDGDTMSYSLEMSNDGGTTWTTSLPDWIGVISNTSFRVTAPTSSQSTYNVWLRIVANDGKGGKGYDKFNVVVATPQNNRPPVVTNPVQFLFANMGQPFSYFMGGANHFSDPDGDTLTYSLQISNDNGATYTSSLPSWLTAANGSYGGTPPFNGQSQYYLKLRIIADDGRGGTVADAFNLIVNDPQP